MTRMAMSTPAWPFLAWVALWWAGPHCTAERGHRGVLVDDKSGYAGLMVSYAERHDREPAIELAADANQASVHVNGKDGLPHASLAVDSSTAPAWHFDSAESGARAAKAATH